jgi:Domain of unknown function (DUF4160)
MVTVLRSDGFRVIIFANDHEPVHVHVFGDGEAKIDLSGPDHKPLLIWARQMTKQDLRRAMRLVMEYRRFLAGKWRDIHGRAD